MLSDNFNWQMTTLSHHFDEFTFVFTGVMIFLHKGFAITLAIGVLVSMFSAIVTTQQFLQVLAGLRPARRLALYGVQAPKAA